METNKTLLWSDNNKEQAWKRREKPILVASKCVMIAIDKKVISRELHRQDAIVKKLLA